MTPLDLDGDNLAERHKNYNQLIKHAINKNLPFEEIESWDEQSDLDRLFKIDIAAHYKNVNYIINVLKSNDMLQVSRAIKQSEWLITDKQYTNYINPQHLNDILIPQMTHKASCKLMLFIRLHMKDELRVQEFFDYYENTNIQTALKWLPNCSLKFIENAFEKYYDKVDRDIFKRLCEKSFSILEIWNKKQSNDPYKKQEYIKSVMFLMNNNTERFLDIVESVHIEGYMKFGPKQTQLLMVRNPDRIINKFQSYASSLDLKTFAKCMKKEDIKEFLLNIKKRENFRHWFKFDNLKYLIGSIPKDGLFEFLKQVFIDKTYDDADNSRKVEEMQMCSFPMACSGFSAPRRRMAKMSNPNTSKKNVYQWYKYAPFNTAFNDLKNMIRAETSAEERTAMLRVMLDAAGKDPQHIHTLLAFYKERHMNEQFRCKQQFINDLMRRVEIHKLKEESWKILDEIFHSMEVYIESNNNVHKCVEKVLIYKLLHKEPIPEVIERKFEQSVNLRYDEKLSQKDNEIIFTYLYNRIEKQIDMKSITSTDEFARILGKLEESFMLLDSWKKQLQDFPQLVQQVKEIIKMKKEKFSNDRGDVSFVYNNKAWRRYFFEESLILQPSQDTCFNVLKHDPTLLKKWNAEIETIIFSDSEPLKHFLRKLRIYWPHTLAKEWSQLYQNRLRTHGGTNSVVQSLCTLLPLEDLLPILEHYAPTDKKIEWSEADKLLLSSQKYLAKNMHHARPHPPPSSVMLYAKGDYLQFAMPSLNAVLNNLSVPESKKIIPILLDAPVSIQKHGIRLATLKLEGDEAQETISKIWKSTKNPSLRSIIFKLTYEILCKKNTEKATNNTWKIMEMFIDSLSDSENKEIYTLLSKVGPLPDHLKAIYLVKSYKFLKSLPAKADCDSLILDLVFYSTNLIDKIDHDFIHEIIVEFVQKLCVDNKVEWNNFGQWCYLTITFLYYSPDEQIQQKRYEQILIPILTLCLKKLDQTENKRSDYFDSWAMFQTIRHHFHVLVLEKKVTVPTKILENIASLIERERPVNDSYIIITIFKLLAIFSKLIEREKSSINKIPKSDGECADGTCSKGDPWNNLLEILIPEFAKSCAEYLKRDIATHFPSIFVLFDKSLPMVVSDLQIRSKNLHRFIDSFIDPELDNSYIIASTLLKKLHNEDDKKEADKFHTIIKSHPSSEVRMFYYSKHSRNPFC